MTIQQMRYFFQVCHWQNITKAADGLHIAQSSLSFVIAIIAKDFVR
jgi:DNA-binding transcriptional LysR family regulator